MNESPETSTTSSGLAIAAFIFAFIAVILIVITIYIFTRNNDIFRTFIDRWSITSGNAPSGPSPSRDTFVAAANSIYVANELTIRTNVIIVNVVPSTNLAASSNPDLAAKFIIDGTSTSSELRVRPPGGAESVTGARIGGLPPDVVGRQTATFIWTSDTSIKRLL